jgi:ABC-type sugar transport system ATPase subunit
MDKNIILAGKHLRKEFHGNVVLDDVTILCKKGVVLALVGENGAGKSTLMNIISGGLQPDGGEIEFEGKPVKFRNSHHALQMGIAFVHQEFSLFDDLTVGENIMLGSEPRRSCFTDSHALHRQAQKVLNELDYQIDVGRMGGGLTPAEQQITEIAKAWVTRPKVLILDEPTSSLSKVEVDKLFRFIGRVKESGVSVVLITHRMDEIFQVCDETIVLKDGVMTAVEPVGNVTKDDLISKMVGREVSNTFPQRCKSVPKDAYFELRNVSVGKRVQNISLRIPKGCVTGFGGLEGQGQRDLARAIFGIEPFTSGQVLIGGEEKSIRTPGVAMKAGIGFVPDDRKTEGLVLPLSIEENMSVLVLDRIARNGILSRKRVRAEAQKGVDRLRIKLSSLKQPVVDLSGGNQQKVVFSKWVTANPEILILDEPTRGVDVQSKLEIYTLIRELTSKGVCILLFSSDMLELIGMSDVIHVMYEGRISGSINGCEATEEALMSLSSGVSPTVKKEG